MGNSTVAAFVLTPYGQMGVLRYLYLTLTLLWYSLIMVANSSLVGVICRDRSLHEPMYLLLCSLFVNEMYGSTTVYPGLVAHMLWEGHRVSLTHCLLQVFCLYSSASVEMCSLSAMAYDRYVSICHPLRYHTVMNTRRVCAAIALIWICSLLHFTVSFSFTARLDFCGSSMDKLFCDQYLLIELACSLSTLSNVLDLLFAVTSIFLPLMLLLFSYVKILSVCRKMSGEGKLKAVGTCVPQVVSLANLLGGCLYHFADTRLDLTEGRIPEELRAVLSVYLLLCQPLLSPLMYGLNLSKIRKACRRLMARR